MTAPALELDHVSVRYEAHGPAIVDDLMVSISQGERVALVGLNGSGKTTLLMASVGLVEHEGALRVCGHTLTHRTLQAVRESVGFLFNVPEDQLLFPKVLDDAAFALLRRGMSPQRAATRAREALEALGVGELAQAPLHHLSHGQKQRVALAGALVSNPPLLLLDEPSAALDPPAKRALAHLLSGLDAAMVVATHDLEFAAAACTRFILLERGRMAMDVRDVAAVRERL
ncbi:MAG: ABC transporter ATP-binding protein [Deltaproteobacteria bacterium]|nr:ABC transporter ATP-binding protein [Deltaproteobacteria bacterium]